MSLLRQIDADLAESMKAGSADRTAVIRLIKSALKNEQIKLGHELSDAEVQKALQREAKQRQDSIRQYRDAKREDLAGAEEMELKTIRTYLPEQMPVQELAALVDQVVAQTGATGPAQMGAVIGAVMQRAAGRADGGQVAQFVRERLK